MGQNSCVGFMDDRRGRCGFCDSVPVLHFVGRKSYRKPMFKILISNQNIPAIYYLPRSDYCASIVANRSNYCGSRYWCRSCYYFTKQTTCARNTSRLVHSLGYGHSIGHCSIGNLLPATSAVQASTAGTDCELFLTPGASRLWWIRVCCIAGFLQPLRSS